MFDSTDGLPGPVMTNRLGKPALIRPEIGPRTSGPFVVQRLAAAAVDVDPGDRTRHGVEAGGEHQRIDFVIFCRRYAPRCSVISSIGFELDVDQPHVRTVEGREIVRVDADALGADRMVVRLQQLCGLGILHDLGDLLADEIGSGVVGGLLQREVVVDRHEGEPAAGPSAPRISSGARCRRPRARRAPGISV